MATTKKKAPAKKPVKKAAPVQRQTAVNTQRITPEAPKVEMVTEIARCTFAFKNEVYVKGTEVKVSRLEGERLARMRLITWHSQRQ